MDLDSAREEFDRLYWEDEAAFGLVIEAATPPEEFPPDVWEEVAYSLFDSTIDVLLGEAQPREVLAIVVDGDDAHVVRGLFERSEDGVARIGDATIDDAGDLDAIAVGGDDIDSEMDFS